MDDNNETPKDQFDKKIENINERKELLLQWRKELDENNDINPFFEPYREGSKKDFLDAYIDKKYLWHKYGDFYQRHYEARAEYWINEAHNQLEAILQKKMFDLQCLWRAEQVSIKEIEICFDFDIWEKEVINCPFLDLITEEEIDMYIGFLTQENLELNDIEFDDWQNYDNIKEANKNIEESHSMPEWYDYHNSRTGNGMLLLMGDIRGEKEEFYMNLVRENERKKNPKPVETSQPFTYFNYFDEEIIKFFVTTFDDETTQKNYFQYSKLYLGGDNDAMHYYNLLEELNDLHDTVPVPSHYDFRQALEKGHNRYYLNKIAEHLPIAYEQYLFNKKMGLSFETKKNTMINLRHFYTESLLKGRLLNGEEPNLNF
jgi:hypothetical protein